MDSIYTMDMIIQIDETLCINCGSCIRACPGDLITKAEFPVPIPNAIHQIRVAAPGLGLGTTFTGSINTACQDYPPLVTMLGLPDGYIPHATCVIGYPSETFHRIPVRKPVKVTWL